MYVFYESNQTLQYIALHHNLNQSTFFDKLNEMEPVFDVSSNKLEMLLQEKDIDAAIDILDSREKKSFGHKLGQVTMLDTIFDDEYTSAQLKIRF